MEGRKIRLLVTVLLVLASMGCGAGSSPFRQGRKAELRKDYDTALVNYQKALQSEPDNALYVLHERVARTQGSFFHLKQEIGRASCRERVWLWGIEVCV